MSRTVHFFILLVCPILLNGQLWSSLGTGVHGTVYSLYADTASERLFVGGAFDLAGDSMVCQIATWDGASWEGVGLAAGDSSCPWSYAEIIAIAKWNNTLYASGMFANLGGNVDWQRLLKWDGMNWDTGSNPNSAPFLENTNGQLFAMGFMSQIGGIPVGRIAKMNQNNQWESLGDSLPFSNGGGSVATSEYFHGEYVFAGNMNIVNGDFREVAAWNGQSWRPLASGILGDSWVNKLKVFKNLLYAGGEFTTASGNASSFLTCWDGSQWFNPLPLVEFTSQVRDLLVFEDKLYVLGTHHVWNGSNWQGPYQIAHYNGQEFCSFGGQDIFPRDVASLNGQLYVTTGPYIHADTFGGIAKWIGGDSTDICISQPVRVQDPAWTQNPTITLYPNPTKSAFSLTLPSNTSTCTLKIHDITGRAVAPTRTYRAGDPPVDVAHLSAGLYFVEVQVKDRVEVVKLVKE